jgi:hypothetical protein
MTQIKPVNDSGGYSIFGGLFRLPCVTLSASRILKMSQEVERTMNPRASAACTDAEVAVFEVRKAATIMAILSWVLTLSGSVKERTFQRNIPPPSSG